MPRITLRHKNGSCQIVIGENMADRLGAFCHKYGANGRLFLFYDANFYALHGKDIQKALASIRKRTVEFVVPSGERSKSNRTLQKLYDYLLSQKISRTDFILACGGGVTTDLVGYLAATTLRGIRWGAVSTTLLGMLDASIGGKTGINHRDGKNLIGAFWQPSFVWCDLRYLMTLPPRQIIAGMGEAVKYGGLMGGQTLEALSAYLESGNLYAVRHLGQIIALCTRHKADIVMKDERESDLRMTLNLGHTFGHAIEKTLGYGKLLHGEALIIGLLAAISLSREVSAKNSRALDKYESLVQQFVRLVRYCKIDCNVAIAAMSMDKKRSGIAQKFILLRRPGQPFIVTDPGAKAVRKSLEQALAFYSA